MSQQVPSEYTRSDVAGASSPGGMPTPNDLPPKKKRSKWLNFFVVIGILALCAAVATGFFVGTDKTDASAPFSSGEKNVMMIDIKGEIMPEGTTYNQKFVLNKIAEAKNDSDNQAILLMLDTPGGSVYECDEVYTKLLEYKAETKRPIYAYCESMCASAGYYIASTADVIYANRNSLVGSIGVVTGQFVDATQLLDDLGVKITTVHSGANKLMGAMYEAPTEEQIAIMQSISDEYYNQFVGVVAEGRGMTTEQVKALADGRVYSASQAKGNGLIDAIGTIDDVDKHIKKDVGENVRFYHEVYEQSPYEEFFGSFKSFLNLGNANSELASTVEALEGLSMTEPMYIYKP